MCESLSGKVCINVDQRSWIKAIADIRLGFVQGGGGGGACPAMLIDKASCRGE